MIRMLMVDAMRGDPENRSAFERERPQMVRKYSIHFGVL